MVNLAAVSGVELGVTQKADTACTVRAEHLERFVNMLITKRRRTSKILGAQLHAKLDHAMLSTRLYTTVHRLTFTYDHRP